MDSYSPTAEHASQLTGREHGELGRELRLVRVGLVVAVLTVALVRFWLHPATASPLSPLILLLLIAWSLLIAIIVVWDSRGVEAARFVSVRFALFAAEVVLLTAIAHFLGGAGWLAILLLVFPTIEWNLFFSGAKGIAGSAVATLSGTALVALEALGWIGHDSFLAVGGAIYREPAYVLAVLVVSALVLIGLSAHVAGYIEILRRKPREMEVVTFQYQRVTDDLRRSHAELESAYAMLRTLQAELVQSARMASLVTLVAGLAHEINTPLGAIVSNRDLLERGLQKLSTALASESPDPGDLEKARQLVDTMSSTLGPDQTAVQRIDALVRSLRNFGRLDEAEVKIVDLHEGLESTLSLLGAELEDRISVVRDYAELPAVECYPRQINQVFMNLLLNSSQAIKPPGTITIRTYVGNEGDGEVAVEIADTGIGIAPQNLRRIFEMGFTTKKARVGMGMGLLISQQIAERHGGRIEVESAVGQGSRFTLFIPLKLPRATERADSLSSGLAAPDRGA